MKSYINTSAAAELSLYAVNDARTYYGITNAVIENLRKKVAKDIYDDMKAVKAFEHVAQYAAKRYAYEFDDVRNWYKMFNAATRRAAAEVILDHYREQILA